MRCCSCDYGGQRLEDATALEVPLGRIASKGRDWIAACRIGSPARKLRPKSARGAHRYRLHFQPGACTAKPVNRLRILWQVTRIITAESFAEQYQFGQLSRICKDCSHGLVNRLLYNNCITIISHLVLQQHHPKSLSFTAKGSVSHVATHTLMHAKTLWHAILYPFTIA